MVSSASSSLRRAPSRNRKTRIKRGNYFEQDFGKNTASGSVSMRPCVFMAISMSAQSLPDSKRSTVSSHALPLLREKLALKERQLELAAATLATNRAAFFSVTQGFDPDPTQRKILDCTDRYVQLLICRQWGKSTTAAVLGAHVAIYEPGSLVLITARGIRQAGELFDKLERTHRAAPGVPKRVGDSATEISLENGSRIVCLPGSAETIVSFSAPRLIIIDEAARTKDDVYKSVRPMLSRSPKGQLFLLSTAYGKRGFFYDVWTRKNSWRKFGPIVGSEVHTKEHLEEERSELGDYWYRQEYECEFVEEIDAVFDHGSIQAALTSETRLLFGGNRAA